MNGKLHHRMRLFRRPLYRRISTLTGSKGFVTTAEIPTICRGIAQNTARTIPNKLRFARITIDFQNLIAKKMATNVHMADNTSANAAISGVVKR